LPRLDQVAGAGDDAGGAVEGEADGQIMSPES
jgi:hypothetical protein